MSDRYVGEGSALFVRGDKCNRVQNFRSSYKWTYPDPGDFSVFAIVNYENSIIGKRNLSAVTDNFIVETDLYSELSSDGSLNFNTQYYYDESLDSFFITVVITGVHKKCNYSSYELDNLVLEDTTASVRNTLKKKSASTESFHKLLNSKPHLKKIYNKIKAKLAK
jgi:hypothetical protein